MTQIRSPVCLHGLSLNFRREGIDYESPFLELTLHPTCGVPQFTSAPEPESGGHLVLAPQHGPESDQVDETALAKTDMGWRYRFCGQKKVQCGGIP